MLLCALGVSLFYAAESVAQETNQTCRHIKILREMCTISLMGSTGKASSTMRVPQNKESKMLVGLGHFVRPDLII